MCPIISVPAQTCSSSKSPVEINPHNSVIQRINMGTTQEDAIISQQVLSIVEENSDASIIVVSDDIDVLILLCHVYCNDHLQMCLILVSHRRKSCCGYCPDCG